MKPRVLWISGAVAATVAVAAWAGLRSSGSHDRTEAASHADDVPSDPAVAAASPAATEAPVAAPSTLPAPTAAPLDPATADDRTVLGMFQNMTDAVDAYGPKACPALGQAFVTFVNDALPAIGRLVRASNAKGEDFNTAFATAHAAQLTNTQEKLKEAITRCGTDPSMISALQTLARQR